VEAMYGAEVFYEGAIESAYPAAYEAALEQAGIKSVAYPKLEILETGKDGFSFKATVTVRPEVKVSDYKGMTAPKDEVTVSAEDVDKELQTYIDRASRLVAVEREAQNGDTVVIDFEGFKDGVPFEGGKAENHSLILGSGAFIPGFEEQLVGVKAGDEKDLNVTFPEDYGAEELAGAPVVFKVKVHEVKERQVPEVDDEFAKDVSEFDTLAEFRKSLEDGVRERRQKDADQSFEDELVRQLVEDHMECDVPEAMVDYRADELLEDYARRITSQGIKFEDYLRMTGTNLEQMREQAKVSAGRSVRVGLALDAVAEAEGLEVPDEKVEEEVKRLAEQYSMEPDKVRDLVSEEDLKHDLRTKMAIDLLVSTAKVGPAPEKKAEKPSEAAEEKPEEPAEAAEEKAKPARKTAARKTTKKAEAPAEGEAKPARKTAAKKTAKKAEAPEE